MQAQWVMGIDEVISQIPNCYNFTHGLPTAVATRFLLVHLEIGSGTGAVVGISPLRHY